MCSDYWKCCSSSGIPVHEQAKRLLLRVLETSGGSAAGRVGFRAGRVVALHCRRLVCSDWVWIDSFKSLFDALLPLAGRRPVSSYLPSRSLFIVVVVVANFFNFSWATTCAVNISLCCCCKLWPWVGGGRGGAGECVSGRAGAASHWDALFWGRFDGAQSIERYRQRRRRLRLPRRTVYSRISRNRKRETMWNRRILLSRAKFCWKSCVLLAS